MARADLRIDVKGCARCGRDHDNVPFRAFRHEGPAGEDGDLATHWGYCPDTGDPILLIDRAEE